MNERKNVKFQLTLPVDLNDRIADWRRQQPSLPNRNEAIRFLVEQALEQAAAPRRVPYSRWTPPSEETK